MYLIVYLEGSVTVSHSKLSSLQLFNIPYLVIILFSLPLPLSLPHTYTEVVVYHKEDPG